MAENSNIEPMGERRSRRPRRPAGGGMTYWSLFAGAGGIDIGLDRCGFRPVVQVECDRDANRVRRRHWPHVEHVRDVIGMSRLPKRMGDWRTRWERPELIVGGFPCQDLSVAGKRAGLQGGRSGLWWQMLRIITGVRPDYVLWENVPGLLSSDGGRDFERVIHSLGERGYFGCTRVLDARHFGVPQRRRRVFGLFARGHLGAVRCAEILAVGTGVSGYSPKGREAGEDVAGTIGGGSGKRGWCQDTDRMTFIPTTSPSVTLRRGNGNSSGGVPFVAFDAKASGQFGFGVGDVSPTLRSMSHKHGNQNAGGQVAVAFHENQRGEVTTNETAGSLKVGGGKPGQGYPAVAFQERGRPGGRKLEIGYNVAYALTAPKDGGRSQERNVMTQTAVRRLTPRECERLMGWPDDWTRWDDKGCELADGPRYRLCGNGVVANVAEWIGRRLMAYAE